VKDKAREICTLDVTHVCCINLDDKELPGQGNGTSRDLAELNSNRLEPLKGNRKGQYSIRINDQGRICFKWTKDDPGPLSVEIVDYH
jgi:hypothetical protein